jgi:hypothetical protein
MTENPSLEKVRALERADLETLRQIWAERIGAIPKLRSPNMLRQVLAWRIQAETYGGLDREIRRKLRQSSETAMAGPVLGSGVRLTREWGGELHEVEVLDDGFLYAGNRYASLSKVATEITGVRWNGPRFFGLREAPKP